MKKLILFFFVFVLIVNIVSGVIGGNYCIKGQDCKYDNLVVGNLSVIGSFFNVSVVNYNVTGVLDISGNITVDNVFVRDNVGIGGDLNVTGNCNLNNTLYCKDGRVGIGTVSPEELLHIYNGDLLISNGYALEFERGDGQNTDVITVDAGDDITIGSQSLDNIYFTVDDAAQALTIRTDGNVGIGTASPGAKLDITGDGSEVGFHIEETGSARFEFVVEDADNYLHINSNNIDDILVLSNIGNIGIGTTTPTEKLTVVGNVNITGNLTYKTIYCESSDLNDQGFPVAGDRYRINISNIDEGYGIGMNTGDNGTNITILLSGVYHLVAQPQVKAGAVGGGKGDFHMWIEKYSSGSWSDIADSNIELSLGTNEEDVIVLATTLKLNQDEKLRFVVSVSDNNVLLHAQSPANEPVIPSIIFTMFRLGS